MSDTTNKTATITIDVSGYGNCLDMTLDTAARPLELISLTAEFDIATFCKCNQSLRGFKHCWTNGSGLKRSLDFKQDRALDCAKTIARQYLKRIKGDMGKDYEQVVLSLFAKKGVLKDLEKENL